MQPSQSRGAHASKRPESALLVSTKELAPLSRPPPEPIEPAKLKELALAVMKAARFPQLATIDGDQPRVRPVSPVRTEEFTIYVANLRSYHKTVEIEANPNVELCYLSEEHDQVRITGRAIASDRPCLAPSRSGTRTRCASSTSARSTTPEADRFIGIDPQRVRSHEGMGFGDTTRLRSRRRAADPRFVFRPFRPGCTIRGIGRLEDQRFRVMRKRVEVFEGQVIAVSDAIQGVHHTRASWWCRRGGCGTTPGYGRSLSSRTP